MEEWQEAMSGEEFGEWIAYARLNPFMEGRMDWRFAMLAAVTASAMSGKKYEVEEFMPKFEVEDEEDERWVKQLAWVEMMNAMMGGEDRRNV